MRVWISNYSGSTTSDTALAYATGRRWPYTDGTTSSPQHLATGAVSTNSDPNMYSRNCGAKASIHSSDTLEFHTADSVYVGTYADSGNAGAARRAVQRLLSTNATRRCYLGGDPRLFPWATGDTLTPDSTITNVFGWWKKRHQTYSGLSSVRPGDASYLIPLGANPNFKGVIFVRGNVAWADLRGRVSVFATGNIVMADDLLYQNPPGTDCTSTGDIFGAIASNNVVIEDNDLQTPFRVNGKVYGGFDDTNDANYNMFLMAAGSGGSTGNWYGEGVVGPGDGNVEFSMLGSEPSAPECLVGHFGDQPATARSPIPPQRLRPGHPRVWRRVEWDHADLLRIGDSGGTKRTPTSACGAMRSAAVLPDDGALSSPTDTTKWIRCGCATCRLRRTSTGCKPE